jgi:hypothetical protein
MYLRTDKTFFLTLSVFFFSGIYKTNGVVFLLSTTLMELLRVLHKSIPQKKKVFAMFHRHQQKDISKFVLQIIKSVKNSTKDTKLINSFCIEFYDMLYYYIMFGKITISKKILRLLEDLALPISYVGEHKWKELFKKLTKLKLP